MTTTKSSPSPSQQQQQLQLQQQQQRGSVNNDKDGSDRIDSSSPSIELEKEVEEGMQQHSQHSQSPISSPTTPPISPSKQQSQHQTPLSLSSSYRDSVHVLQSPVLRSNLIRHYSNERDPLLYYDVIQTIGVGSMGSVARVRKRPHVVGGSARKENTIQQQRQQQQIKPCFKIPLLGGFFRYCIHTKRKRRQQQQQQLQTTTKTS